MDESIDLPFCHPGKLRLHRKDLMMDPDDPNAPNPKQVRAAPAREDESPPPQELEETIADPLGDKSSRVKSTHREPGSGHSGRSDVVGALPGKFGRYLIECKLGEGGMGAVYRAHDTQLDRKVALKTPSFSDRDGTDAMERFYREARAMATVQHANLCPVFDVGEVEGVHYLTMALIEGHSLSDDLTQRTSYPSSDAAMMIRKLALALESVHKCGIVHRDVKPGNVMVRSDGDPILMDFGLARQRREEDATLTIEGDVLGTPAYMSPEQVNGSLDQIGPWTDVYALGVILYQMLTGRLPFTGSLGSILTKIVTEIPTPPSEIHDVDPKLETICLRAMARRIEDRYSTAGDLASDLQRLLTSGESAARLEVEAETRPGVWGARGPLLIGGSVVLLIIGAAVVAQRHPKTDVAEDINANAMPAAESTETLAPSPPDERWRLPPEPRRYPSFFDAVSYAPAWLVDDEQAPFDVEEYFKTPLPEDNAAPLYLNALAEFESGVLVSCFPESERARRAPVVNDRRQRLAELYRRWIEDPRSVPKSEIEGILDEYDAGFQWLLRAQRLEECVFETGVDITTMLPHVQATRDMARVLQLRARLELEKDNLDGALENLRRVFRMRRDVGHRSGEVTTLVAVAIDGVACEGILREVLLHPSLTKADCDLALKLLDEQERHYDQALRRGWQGAFVVTRVLLHDIQFRVGPFSPERLAELIEEFGLNSDTGSPGEFLAATWRLREEELGVAPARIAQQIDSMTDIDFDRELSIANASYKSILEMIDRPLFERYKLASRLWNDLSRNQDSKFIRYQMPTVLPVFEAHRRGMTTLLGTKSLVCLQRWKLTHSDVPPDLAFLLRDAGVTTDAIDPYGDGEMLRLTRVDGEPVIYSIGADGIDDEGLIEWNLTSGGQGDYSFRLETTQELSRRRAGQ